MKFQLVSSKPRIFPSTASPSTGSKFSFFGLVRTGSKCHLPFDHRDISVSQADLIAGIDDGSTTDSRSVGQIPRKHTGCEPDGGVEAARGVHKERTGPEGGVVDARSVAEKRLGSAGRVEVAIGVAEQRIDSGGRVEVSRGIAKERIDSDGGVLLPVVLF
jgi:hypothetical protein